MNIQMQCCCCFFRCFFLWCCILPDFVAQINNFFSLVLFSAVILKRRGKKLICRTIKYKLVLQRCNLCFFILKTFNQFCRKYLKMTQVAEIQGYQMTHAFVDPEVKSVIRVTTKLLRKSCPITKSNLLNFSFKTVYKNLLFNI